MLVAIGRVFLACVLVVGVAGAMFVMLKSKSKQTEELTKPSSGGPSLRGPFGAPDPRAYT